MVDLHEFFCAGVRDPTAVERVFDGRIEATAELVLTSHIKCDANKQKTLACASSWVDARAFAEASYEAYGAAVAAAGTGAQCSCGQALFAEAEVTIAAWADIWADIYHSCVPCCTASMIASRCQLHLLDVCMADRSLGFG